jgi:hypothetical protein
MMGITPSKTNFGSCGFSSRILRMTYWYYSLGIKIIRIIKDKNTHTYF